MIDFCGAKSKLTNKPCRRSPCKNGRCHLHGGYSTGPKTKEGKENQRKAVLKHGFYTKHAVVERNILRKSIEIAKKNLINHSNSVF